MTMTSLPSETSLAQARATLRIRTAATVAGCPLRFRPVIISGPNDGFMVVNLGFAKSNGFEIVR